MTPFDALMSVLTMLRPLTVAAPFVTLSRGLGFDGLEHLHRLELGGHDLAGSDVVGEDLRERRRVGEDRVELVSGHRHERSVGRGEHRERNRTRERLDQTSLRRSGVQRA